jgi:hypothetical protein
VALRAILAFAVAAFSSLWAGLGQAQAPDILFQCKGWRVTVDKQQLGRPSEEVCGEIAARSLRKHEACRAVVEKLTGGQLGGGSCKGWYRRETSHLTGIPDVPDDIWNAYHDNDSMRVLLQQRLDKDWEQPQVQKALEAVGFTCGMSRESMSLHVHVEPSTPIFVCSARVSWIGTRPDEGGVHYLWVEVQFAEQAEPRRWQRIVVHSDGYALF